MKFHVNTTTRQIFLSFIEIKIEPLSEESKEKELPEMPEPRYIAD